MRENRLKQILAGGGTAVGLFAISPDPNLVELSAIAGFDFTIVDMEHGPLDSETVASLVRAADAAGITPIVRVPQNNGPLIQRALDVGSGGVQVPQIETRADAEAVVHGARYTPLGRRGLSYYTRAADWSTRGTIGVLDRLNAEQLAVIHVEGTRGIENLDEILGVDGIDVVFLGPYDLSQSLGIPGQVASSEVTGLMEDAVSRIRGAGKWAGTFADEATAARRWINAGVTYVAIGVDVGHFHGAAKALVDGIRS